MSDCETTESATGGASSGKSGGEPARSPSPATESFTDVFGNERGRGLDYEPPAPPQPTAVERARELTAWMNANEWGLNDWGASDWASRAHQRAQAQSLGLEVQYIEMASRDEGFNYDTPSVLITVYDEKLMTIVGLIELMPERAALLTYDKPFPRRVPS